MKSSTSLFLGVLVLAIIANYLLRPKQAIDAPPTVVKREYNYDVVRTQVALSRFLKLSETDNVELLKVIEASEGRELIAIPLVSGPPTRLVNICTFTNQHPRGACTGGLLINSHHEIGQLLQSNTPLTLMPANNNLRVKKDFTFTVHRE